jgi:hypothetical protein
MAWSGMTDTIDISAALVMKIRYTLNINDCITTFQLDLFALA